MQQLMRIGGIGYSLCVLMLIAATFSVVEAQQIQYGVYIGDQSVVNPDPNYNLYSAGANSKNVFDGKVGIGTTTPTERLTVVGGNGIRVKETDLGAEFIRLQGSIAHFALGASTVPPFLVNFTSGNFSNIAEFQSFGATRMSIATNGNVNINGTLTATSKNFQIAHPVEPERKLLIHSALEGPEAAVYYRGEAQLKDGKAAITLPSYFEALTRKEQRTVQLTPIDGWSPLYVVEGVQDGQFTVRAGKGGNLSQRFYWEVKAVRADVPTLVVEKLKGSE